MTQQGHRQRYWRFRPIDHGDRVAEHDPRDHASPGHVSGPLIKVVVSQDDGKHGIHPTTIEVIDKHGQTALDLNHGTARWLGVRLIEAAALDEAAGYIVADHEAEVGIDRLGQWLSSNAADQRLPNEAYVDTALRLLAEYKDRVNAGEIAAPDPRAAAVDELRRLAKQAMTTHRVGDTGRFLERRRALQDATGLTDAEFQADVFEWFSPSDRAVLRGMGIR